MSRKAGAPGGIMIIIIIKYKLTKLLLKDQLAVLVSKVKKMGYTFWVEYFRDLNK